MSKNKLSAAKQVATSYDAFLLTKGLTPRDGQKQMMSFCFGLVNNISVDKEGKKADNVKQPALGVVEAGTGTGKTLGYSLPLIPLAKERGKTLILSTATVALQEQIINKDLPDIRASAGIDFTFTMAKGRGRYFCKLRCGRHMDHEENAYGYVKEDVANLNREFDLGLWDGDRDAYPDEISDSTWQNINAIGGQCPNNKCPHFTKCPFFQARSRLESSDVIVANHDIVLADLALGGGVILPVPEETIYVFDEGHHLSHKAIDHFATNCSLDYSVRWCDEIVDMMIPLTNSYSDKMDEYCHQIIKDSSLLKNEMSLLRNFLLSSLSFRNEHDQRDVFRFPGGEIPVVIIQQIKPLTSILKRINKTVEQMTTLVDEAGNKISPDEAADHKMLVGEMNSRIDSIIETLSSFIARQKDEGLPIARWITVLRDRKNEVIINTSPIHAGKHLTDNIWNKAFACIITSATIRSLGSFDAFLEQAGLAKETPTLLAKSPFDYEKNGILYVPKMASTPKNPLEHTSEVGKMLPSLITRKKGCLVLFASRRQMTDVYDLLPVHLQSQILVQGRLPKGEIVAKHKLRIDQNQHSVIFGLASFSEGVDLPGDYCDNVVISKLPFSVPSDPVSETLREWMNKAGRDTFNEITVPEACLKLIQSVGRLIRTETDTGAVTILDTRIKNSRYGQNILNSLPPFRRVIR